MAADRDGVTLSAGERQRLADLEAALRREDPGLDASLSRGRRPIVSLGPTRQLAVAVIIAVAGLGLTLATFTRWLWVAVVGVIVLVAGMAAGIDSIQRIRTGRPAPP